MPHPYDYAFSGIKNLVNLGGLHLASRVGEYIGEAIGGAKLAFDAYNSYQDYRDEEEVNSNPYFVPPGSRSISQFMFRRSSRRRSYGRRFGGVRRGYRAFRGFVRRRYPLVRRY